ncbi:Aste57867_9078 [Aphanomyces stellatus]|uniref:Aste57867_9078 protein n=1 Tax=Aphanomyces stellatus TaxID=120398 RepID=A0A485KM11_9STRA|nr:hypothetical protein As57867_009042 [Aphanomyces stellatus]VFT85962.1 Aste57867_9078 [Aphanomyces stellatus]
MKGTEEFTPLATSAPGGQLNTHVPTIYVQADPVHVAIMDDRTGTAVQAPPGIWKAGIFECFEHIVPNALMAYFCPCVALAQITSRLDIYGGYQKVLVGVAFLIALENFFHVVADWVFSSEGPRRHPHQWTTRRPLNPNDDDDDYEYTYDERRQSAYSSVTFLLAIALVAFVTAVRTRVRKRFAIHGSECEDFGWSLCCMSCTIAQMGTQVGSYTPGECTFGPRDTLQGYTVQLA